MAYQTAPPNLRSLEQRVRNLEADDGLALRRQVTMAMVIVGQMLPEGAVKGGTAMALRYGRSESRFTQDLDATSGTLCMRPAQRALTYWATLRRRLLGPTPSYSESPACAHDEAAGGEQGPRVRADQRGR